MSEQPAPTILWREENMPLGQTWQIKATMIMNKELLYSVAKTKGTREMWEEVEGTIDTLTTANFTGSADRPVGCVGRSEPLCI